MKHSPFDATISVLDAVTSALNAALGTAIPALGTAILSLGAWHRVSGDRRVSITQQICIRVTNP